MSEGRKIFFKCKAKNLLIPASRQYAHDDGIGLLHGYDATETEKIVSRLQAENQTLAAFLETLKERFETMGKWAIERVTKKLCEESIADIDHYLKRHTPKEKM